MIISAENNLDKLQTTLYSFTSTSVASGGTVTPVKNINSFTPSWAIQMGKTGEEQSEIQVLGTAAVSGTSLTLVGTLIYSHPIDTPIYNIHYDKIIFKRSITGTAGTATALTNGTVSITPDSLYTNFDDTTGTTGYAYKTQYYNSVSGDMSSESDWFVPGGPTFYSLSKLRQRSKDALYNAGYIKSDDVLTDWINEWQEQMGNAAIKVNQSYALGTTYVGFDGTAGYGTITVSDFKSARKMEVSYDGGINYIQTKEIPINMFSNSDIFTAVYPTHYWTGDNTFGIRPYQQGGTARVIYSKIYANMANDTDELSSVLRPYTSGCIEYVLYRAYDNDQKQEFAESHYGKFKLSRNDFISEITPRDQTGPKTIQFDDTLSGRADDFDLEYFTW